MVALFGAMFGYYVNVKAVFACADGSGLGTRSTLHVGICTSSDARR